MKILLLKIKNNKNVTAKLCLLPVACSIAPVPEDKWLDRKSNHSVVLPWAEMQGQGSLGQAASHEECWALLFKLPSWSFPWCQPHGTQADTAWHIIPLSPGAEAQQPGLLHCHQGCFSSGHCGGFSCQICLTCHRLSFPISIFYYATMY